jgi:cytochrome c oxidase assembly protein Cox11
VGRESVERGLIVMRFNAKSAGGEVVAVTGVNTVSFAFLTTKATNKDLLGFAVERADPAEDEKYFMKKGLSGIIAFCWRTQVMARSARSSVSV